MKKLMCILMSLLMVFGVFAIPASAENGPYPDSLGDLSNVDPDKLLSGEAKISMIVAMNMDEDTYEMELGVIFPSFSALPVPDIFKGMSYDIETNTLTIENVKAPIASLMLLDMGDDFKINVKGYNELGDISSSTTGRGASVTVTGDGELILNKDGSSYSAAFLIDAQDTASFFKAEKDVNLKFYSDVYYGVPAIVVDGSSITDPAQLIQLEGVVKKGTISTYPYVVELFEQISAYDLQMDVVDYCDEVFEKDGVYYAGFESYYGLGEDDFYGDPTGYEIIPVAYDEILCCYAAPMLEYESDEYFFADYAAAGYNKIAPEDVPVNFKNFFLPYETLEYNLALSEDGTKKYAFESYFDEDFGTDAVVYLVIEHPVYGNVLKYLPNKNDLEGLVPQKIGEKNYCQTFMADTFVMNDGGSIKNRTVELKKAENVTGGIKISWSKLDGAEKYVIYRKTSAKGEWKKLYTTKTNASAYTDKSAKSGKKYYYTVQGVGDGEYSKYDDIGLYRTYIAAPKISSVENKKTCTQIKWGKVSGADYYEVYRKAKGGSWKKLDSVKSTTFNDKNAKAGTVYEYKVRARVGKSTASAFSSAKKIVRLTVPKLSKATAASGKVTLTYGKVKGADKYYIYRKTGSGSFKRIASTTSTKYVDKNVKKGTTYTYTVKAVRSSYISYYNTTGLKVKAK